MSIILSQCLNYTVGLVAGSICNPLCKSEEIRLRRCLGHGVKLHVLEAEWQGKIVILKTPKNLGTDAALQMATTLVPHHIRREEFTIEAGALATQVCENTVSS